MSLIPMHKLVKFVLAALGIVLFLLVFNFMNFFFGWPCGSIASAKINKLVEESTCSVDDDCRVVSALGSGYFRCETFPANLQTALQIKRLLGSEQTDPGLHVTCGPQIFAECMSPAWRVVCENQHCKLLKGIRQ